MSLDLTEVASQVSTMVTRLKASGQEKQQHLRNALYTIHNQAAEIERLTRKLAASKTTWLTAGLVSGLDQHHKIIPIPDEFSIIAVDGSQISIDRHRSARCYLINIGSVILHYGSEPIAILDSLPHLYAEDEDLVITAPSFKGRQQPIDDALLGIKRSVDECQRLVELATELSSNSTALALFDGSLILWSLEAYPEFVTKALLENGFLSNLDRMRNLNKDKQVALASYISLPRSTDVTNVLKVALCPQEIIDSDHDCPACQSRECDAVAGIQDHQLFSNLLKPGERSDLFISQSRIQQRYGVNKIYFFYLKVEEEIARVEIPQWVATDEVLLNLAHALILDQCWHGHEYPVALSEAHEKAVVTTADRECFWQLVETYLVKEHQPISSSAKSKSKRMRWI